MDNSKLLYDDIEKRIKNEMLGNTFSRPFHKTLIVDSPNFKFDIEGDLWYLVSEKIDIPIEYQLNISAGEHFLRTSKLDYENSVYKINSFRYYIQIKTKNYNPLGFVPFKLEFLIVTPD